MYNKAQQRNEMEKSSILSIFLIKNNVKLKLNDKMEDVCLYRDKKHAFCMSADSMRQTE